MICQDRQAQVTSKTIDTKFDIKLKSVKLTDKGLCILGFSSTFYFLKCWLEPLLSA